jgi:selenocysteine-specific elongation factor
VRPDQWHLSRTVDASLRVLESVSRPIERKGAFSVHLGAGDYSARLGILGRAPGIAPGEEGAVRLRLEGSVPVPLMPGDRYILRDRGRDQTIGGGQILDVDPVLPLGRANPSLSAARVVGERGWIEASQLERLTGERLMPTAGNWVIAPGVEAAIAEQILAGCRGAGTDGLDIARLNEVERALLQKGIAGVTVVANRAYVDGAVPRALSDGATRALAVLDREPWSPPDLPLSERAALRELERQGLACQADDVWFSARAIRSATDVLGQLLERSPDGITVSDARTALGTTRKYIVPLLRHLDATGVTRRLGDRRIAGPVLARRG